MKEVFFEVLVLLLIGIVTVHFVSWVGSVLHSVPNGGESNYAVFTFRSDQNKAMSTNMLMNILVPNVCLIFLYMFIEKNGIKIHDEVLLLYVFFYYLYRIVLIIGILNRRELFCFRYEITCLLIGCGLSVLLVKYFLKDTNQIFIPISELVNEFWLVIILLIYKFMILFFDKIFSQKTVVTEGMLDNYIINKFNWFYKKFEDIVCVTDKDNGIWVLLFSIMIFENYNRGRFLRIIEEIKVLLSKSATVGIMQIKSDSRLSDKRSIEIAYDRLKKQCENGKIEDMDAMNVMGCAMQYNPDEDYAKSVSFIFQHLYEYIKYSPKYKIKFCIVEEAASEYDETVNVDGNVEGTGLEEYMTFDDLQVESGMSSKEAWEEIRKEKLIIYLDRKEVQNVLLKDKD